MVYGPNDFMRVHIVEKKDKVTYMIMLLRDKLFELSFNVAPVKLVTYFELATINAFRSQFGLRIIGCHFYFFQAVRGAIVKLR